MTLEDILKVEKQFWQRSSKRYAEVIQQSAPLGREYPREQVGPLASLAVKSIILSWSTNPWSESIICKHYAEKWPSILWKSSVVNTARFLKVCLATFQHVRCENWRLFHAKNLNTFRRMFSLENPDYWPTFCCSFRVAHFKHEKKNKK